VAVVLVIAGGIIYKIKADHERQLAAQQAEKERVIELEKARRAEQEKKFEIMEAMLKKQIAEAKSDAERLAIQKQLDDAHRSHAASGGGGKAAATKDKKDTGSAAAPAPALIKTKKAVSDDPLDGLKL
jgi:hypothetical protein